MKRAREPAVRQASQLACAGVFMYLLKTERQGAVFLLPPLLTQ